MFVRWNLIVCSESQNCLAICLFESPSASARRMSASRWVSPASTASSAAPGRASSGSIVVMHDGHHKNPRADRRRTVDATRALVPALRARGFDFVTLCSLAPQAP